MRYSFAKCIRGALHLLRLVAAAIDDRIEGLTYQRTQVAVTVATQLGQFREERCVSLSAIEQSHVMPSRDCRRDDMPPHKLCAAEN